MTYEEIIKIHPEQQTVIVSGFSKSDRVQKMEKLGVTLLILKAFRLEELAMTVKRALQ